MRCALNTIVLLKRMFVDDGVLPSMSLTGAKSRFNRLCELVVVQKDAWVVEGEELKLRWKAQGSTCPVVCTQNSETAG